MKTKAERRPAVSNNKKMRSPRKNERCAPFFGAVDRGPMLRFVLRVGKSIVFCFQKRFVLANRIIV